MQHQHEYHVKGCKGFPHLGNEKQIPDKKSGNQILVDNPARLYGF